MKFNIHWAGDSTVKFNRINTYPQTGIGQVLDLYLESNVRIYNYAENGRSTKSFLAEGRLEPIKEKLKEGDFLFIQFGHNDQKVDVERHTEAFGEYQENLMIFINTAKAAGATPVLITPLYRRHFDENGKLKESVHLNYPNAIIELAKSEKIPYIDLCEKSRRLIEQAGNEKSEKWFMNLLSGEYDRYSEGLTDNTHLRHEGAVVMAGLVAEGLSELGGIFKELLINIE